MSENNNHKHYNIDVKHIIGNTPSWLIHSGITTIAVIVFIFLFASFFIKYPDKLTSNGILTSTNNPERLISRSNGYIDSILIKDGTIIEADTKLIYLRNPANKNDIQILNKWNENKEKDKYKIPIPNDLQLGEIQSIYAKIHLKQREYIDYKNQVLPEIKIGKIRSEIRNIKKLSKSINKELKLSDEEYIIYKNKKERSDILISKGLISTEKYEDQLIKYNKSIRQNEEIEKKLTINNIEIDQLELEIINIKLEREKNLIQYENEISEFLLQLQFAIEKWTQDYYVHSNIAGTLIYHQMIDNNSTIITGQDIGYIIPKAPEKVRLIKSELPIEGFAKINSDTKVIVKFHAYPTKNYGIVHGQIHTISEIPFITQGNKRAYQVKIEIPKPTISSSGKKIPYNPEMTATIELITEDKSILSRVFNQLKTLLETP